MDLGSHDLQDSQNICQYICLPNSNVIAVPIYGCEVEITPDINPIYVGLERSCPRDSKNVTYVVVGLV